MKGVNQASNMPWMKEYSWNGRILQEIMLETKSKLQQSWNYNKVVTATESIFNQILRDLTNLRDHIKKEGVK
jgi:hypothetical protein